ncbi:flagellar hook-length control protein FliK [Psychromonas arctica]|uniref:flagellar hook-length control protein FliK n=1 Tax=Psychromonas arctica TaxID=168275 RepID=UPI002FD4D08C
MVQPLMLPSTTTSDLKAHKESEIVNQSILSGEQSGSEQKQQAFSQLLNDNIEEHKILNTAASFENSVDENEFKASKDQSDLETKKQALPQLLTNKVEGNKISEVAVSTNSELKVQEGKLQIGVAESDEDRLDIQNTKNLSASSEELNKTNVQPQAPQSNNDAQLAEQETDLATFNEATDQTQLNSSTINTDQLGDKSSLQLTSTLVPEQAVEVASPQQTPIILSTVNSHKVNVENDQSSNSEQLDFQGIDDIDGNNLDDETDETEEIEKGAGLAFENVFEQPSTLNKNDIEDLEVNKSEAFTFDNLNGQVTKDNFGIQEDSTEGVDSTVSLNNGDAIKSQQAQLLSSIQDAQQINTNVNNRSESSSTNSIEKMSLLGAKESVQSSMLNASQEQAAALEEGKQEGLSTLSNKTIELTKEQSNLVLPDSVQENEPLDSKDSTLPTLKVEGQALTQTVMDVNGAKPIQTSIIQSDKLVSMNQHMQATNNLLQEPLDIQSKQAAHMMGERVMMMLSEGKQEVQIRLDPAELGSMFIKVQVQQDQVQLNIQTQASLSKDIIDQNMPRLREQLAQQGIQLGDANVEQQSQQQQQSEQRQSMQAMNSRSASHTDIVEDNSTAIWMPSKIASNEQGIDYYA